MSKINLKTVRGVLKTLNVNKEGTDAIVSGINLKQDEYTKVYDRKIAKADKSFEVAKEKYQSSKSKAESESIVIVVSELIKFYNIKIEVKDEKLETEKQNISERLNLDSNQSNNNQGFNKSDFKEFNGSYS
ncbi:hypothetical protein [Poseidonibacter ostreae]|uniref:Uncharacterized protein n=1 Tax=Poseidonibacter ostreae TaxID=2654171 RepID=A0A6L4WTY0_9BACT|nr:hypothetical protein [Poseidonibacter ostreae]KAB7889554.1 hypothetical protein GBG19_05725 [Poseidonibacter ostreae]